MMTEQPMFVSGAIYRRRELHEKFGGQRQGGISTPAKHAMVWIFTGDQGEQYGYTDGFQDDGTFWYTGEGQRGNMQMVRGNAAIREHRSLGKRLHLFEYVRRSLVRYTGEASYIGHHEDVSLDAIGKSRSVIVFELELVPTEIGKGTAEFSPPPRETRGMWTRSMDELRLAAIEPTASDLPPAERKRLTRRRSQAVRVYVLRRAKGRCEGCGLQAPFKTVDDRPYLEPHHIRRHADGGPDHPDWVIALCPNCHRRVHFGADGTAYNTQLADSAVLRPPLAE